MQIKDQNVNNYLNYLQKELNFSDNTIIGYKRDLYNFITYVNKNNIDYLSIDRTGVMNYLKYLDKCNLKNATIARKISTLRSFYNYLLLNNLIKYNIFKNIRNPKIERKLPNYLNYNDMETLLDSIDTTTTEGLKKRLLMETLYATGCRVSEVCNILVSNIDKTNKNIRIMGKGSKERIVYYGDYVAMYLDKYLHDNVNGGSIYLFVNKKGEKYTIQEVEGIVKEIVDSISLSTHVTPHTIRHTFATHLLNNGADIKSVQALLGHASLNTTGIYTHVSTDRLKDVYFHTFKR